MKKSLLLILLVAIFALFGGLLLFDWSLAREDDSLLVKQNTINGASYKKGELIVKFKKNIFKSSKAESEKLSNGLAAIAPERVKVDSIKKLNKEFKVIKLIKLSKNNKKAKTGGVALKDPKGVKKLKLKNLYKLIFAENKDISEAVEEYSRDTNVVYAEPNYRMEIMSTTPNDPYYSSYGTWGQSYYDLYGLYNIAAGNAWDTTTGSSSVVVAVIDTGADYNHEDLSANMWTNSGEIPNNSIDDDSNGYVDDYYGYDFYNYDKDPIDDHGHGTHCSGTIAGVTNNSVGVAGVSWSSKIMAVKFLSSGGYGYYSDAILGIQYAVDNGAQILSNSWGGWGSSQSLQDAIDYAYSRGAVFVAAAGNSNYDTVYYQPAGLNNVFTVAATDYNDDKAWFSNYGNEVDVAAPGVDTLSLRASGTYMGTAVGSNYTRASGTSMATPHVSGVAALVWAAHPTMSNQEIENNIKNYADDFGSSGFDIYYGYGRINAEQAVLAQAIPLSSSNSSVSASSSSLSVGGSTNITVTVKNNYNVTVAGKAVTLTTNLGTLGTTSGYSNSNGQLTTTLTSSMAGTATVTAISGSTTLGQVRIVFSESADTTPPSKVTEFKAVAGSKSAVLYWTNPTDSDFAGVLIRRKSGGYPESKDDGLLVYNGTGYSVADTGLTNGQTYYYSAYTYDGSDNYSDAEQTSITPKKSAETDEIPPAPVEKLKAKQKDNKVLLKWINPEDVDFKGILIRRSLTGFPVKYNQGKKIYRGKGKKIKKIDLKRKFVDKKIKSGKTYYYSVFSFDDAGNYSIVRRVKINVY